MEFISKSDITDNILNCEDSDISYANDVLSRLCTSMGLKESEILIPARVSVKQYGAALACEQRALAMVGSDTTVMVNGTRADDVYLQKYKAYKAIADELRASLSYSDFAVEGVSEAGKGGVGVIRLSRG